MDTLFSKLLDKFSRKRVDPFANIRTPKEMLESSMIVSHYAGSLAYGTNLPTSDVDIRGIFCADECYHRSPWLSCGEISVPEDEDTKYYELTKFMTLVVDQNPNIIETLWVDDKSIIDRTPAFDHLVENRHLLLSSKCAFTFSGYAHAQLQRIKGHNKWINNPQPEQPPRQIDYMSLVQDFSADKFFKFTGVDMETYRKDWRLIPYGNNIFGMYHMPGNGYELFDDRYTLNTIFEGERPQGVDATPVRILKFNQDVYKKDKEQHKKYWNWKKNRNEARSELEEKFGYDTKHAMHLMRLLRMGEEILTEQQVNVFRPDAKELLEIREGKYTYDEIVGEAERLDQRIKELYKTTGLRKRVDTKSAARLLVETQEIIWGR